MDDGISPVQKGNHRFLTSDVTSHLPEIAVVQAKALEMAGKRDDGISTSGTLPHHLTADSAGCSCDKYPHEPLLHPHSRDTEWRY